MINWLKGIFGKKRSKVVEEGRSHIYRPREWVKPPPNPFKEPNTMVHPSTPPPDPPPDPPFDLRYGSTLSMEEGGSGPFLDHVIVDPLDSVKVYDLRNEQPNPPPPVRGKMKLRVRRGRVASRRPSTVTGICVHQTAARFGVSDAAVRAAGGDRELALARRSKGVACHVMAFADGFVAWPNPLDWYVYHGNGFNSDTLGIEIDGDFAGLSDVPETAFRKKDNPDVLTPELELAAKRAIKLLVEEGRKAGMDIKYIYAHRQSSPTRRSDPGEEIWKKIVLDYAVNELGLETKPALIRKKGYTIPSQWDPEGPGDYWDDPKR